MQNSIVKEVKDKFSGITVKDVSSAIMQAKDIDIPEGMSIIDIVADKFILDDGKSVSDPIGNFSSSFTLKAQVVLAQKDYIRQIFSIFKKANLQGFKKSYIIPGAVTFGIGIVLTILIE